jgi:hypothetical protein
VPIHPLIEFIRDVVRPVSIIIAIFFACIRVETCIVTSCLASPDCLLLALEIGFEMAGVAQEFEASFSIFTLLLDTAAASLGTKGTNCIKALRACLARAH